MAPSTNELVSCQTRQLVNMIRAAIPMRRTDRRASRPAPAPDSRESQFYRSATPSELMDGALIRLARGLADEPPQRRGASAPPSAGSCLPLPPCDPLWGRVREGVSAG